MKNKKIGIILPLLVLPSSLFLYSCANGNFNSENKLSQTNIPKYLRQDVYEVLSSNEKPIKTTHVINDLDLEIDIKESVDNYDLKIKFKSNANELFSLNETNFSSESKYKILAGKWLWNYKWIWNY